MSRDMLGRTCLVTGSTDGHGKAVALALAARGADVVLHARSRAKAMTVRDELARAAGGKAPEILLADLAEPDEIRAAVEGYLASGRPLHVLVNNAGLVSLDRRTNVRGHELTLAVNYLAMVQLTLGLLPRLRECGPARIVNVSSDTYRIAKLELDDLQLERDYGMMRAYAQSKLAIVYFTLELSRRLEGRLGDHLEGRRESKVVTVNAVDPGPVASNIGADNPGLAYRLVGPLIRRFFPSAERAARTAVRLATDPALEHESGGYWRSLARRAKPLDFDPAFSVALWQKTLDLCGLPEPRID